MRIVLFDTCGAEASVALADTALTRPVVALSTMPGRTASERLVAVTREVLAQAAWMLSDLEAIAVVTGPGSFTGVRVGLSAAKGLGEALEIPMVAVSRLAILGATAESRGSGVCVLLDAGRGEYYVGIYLDGETLSEALLPRESAIAAARGAGAVVVCEKSLRTSLQSDLNVSLVVEPTAADALPFALKRITARSYDDPMTLDANYLRRTDLEIFAKPATRA